MEINQNTYTTLTSGEYTAEADGYVSITSLAKGAYAYIYIKTNIGSYVTVGGTCIYGDPDGDSTFSIFVRNGTRYKIFLSNNEINRAHWYPLT